MAFYSHLEFRFNFCDSFWNLSALLFFVLQLSASKYNIAFGILMQ